MTQLCWRTEEPFVKVNVTWEPLSAESELWAMENVIMSPHISGGTEIYNERAVGIFCDNLRRYLANEPLNNLADPARGY